MTTPLPVRRRWPIVVALLGAVGLAAAVFALTRGGSEPAKQAPVEMASTQPAPTPPPPTVAPTVAPIDQATPPDPTPVPPPPVVDETKPAPKPVRPAHVKTETKPAPVETKPVETKPVEIAKPVETPKPVTPKIVDNATLVSEYKNVGAELKALETTKGVDAASDLQSRYRMIRIADAMSSQDKRDETAKVLAKLHSEIAGRK